ncbi:hypothetical protein SDJN02_01767, partial [Cucurbita argyrosperma subsp. argyrosperma]
EQINGNRQWKQSRARKVRVKEYKQLGIRSQRKVHGPTRFSTHHHHHRHYQFFFSTVFIFIFFLNPPFLNPSLTLQGPTLTNLLNVNFKLKMGSKAPSWADQWGSGNYGVEDDDKMVAKKGSSNGSSSKKMTEVKAAASAGFVKAKAVAAVGAQKVKSGTSVGIKWVKNQYQKKVSK